MAIAFSTSTRYSFPPRSKPAADPSAVLSECSSAMPEMRRRNRSAIATVHGNAPHRRLRRICELPSLPVLAAAPSLELFAGDRCAQMAARRRDQWEPRCYVVHQTLRNIGIARTTEYFEHLGNAAIQREQVVVLIAGPYQCAGRAAAEFNYSRPWRSSASCSLVRNSCSNADRSDRVTFTMNRHGPSWQPSMATTISARSLPPSVAVTAATRKAPASSRATLRLRSATSFIANDIGLGCQSRVTNR